MNISELIDGEWETIGIQMPNHGYFMEDGRLLKYTGDDKKNIEAIVVLSTHFEASQATVSIRDSDEYQTLK